VKNTISVGEKDTSVRMAMRLQSAPFIQPLNKDYLHNTRTTHQQNEMLVNRIARIAALYKNQVHTISA